MDVVTKVCNYQVLVVSIDLQTVSCLLTLGMVRVDGKQSVKD